MRLTEKDIIRLLRNMGDQLAPLVINSLKEEVSLLEGFKVDTVVDFSIQNGSSFAAVVEIVPVGTPQNILKKALQFSDNLGKAKKPSVVPLIVAPFIGVKQAEILADRGISWLDLSGNMSISVSNRIYIERTGKRNRFPDTSPIKKIFQGTSSLVSRTLLLKPEGFESLEKIVDFINQRNANITLSTVSKVLKKLEDELLINKGKSRITVADPEMLLERLAEGYRNSTERKRRNTYRFAVDNIKKVFFNFKEVANIDFAAGDFYAAQIKGLSVTDRVSIFIRDIEKVQKAIENNWINVTFDTEFGNLNVTETNESGVWFNVIRSDPYEPVVDDIELYLEMTVDTPRGPKIAEQLKRRILQKADSSGRKDS